MKCFEIKLWIMLIIINAKAHISAPSLQILGVKLEIAHAPPGAIVSMIAPYIHDFKTVRYSLVFLPKFNIIAYRRI